MAKKKPMPNPERIRAPKAALARAEKLFARCLDGFEPIPVLEHHEVTLIFDSLGLISKVRNVKTARKALESTQATVKALWPAGLSWDAGARVYEDLRECLTLLDEQKKNGWK